MIINYKLSNMSGVNRVKSWGFFGNKQSLPNPKMLDEF